MKCKKCKSEIYELIIPNILTKDATMDLFQRKCGRVIAIAHSNTQFCLSRDIEV